MGFFDADEVHLQQGVAGAGRPPSLRAQRTVERFRLIRALEIPLIFVQLNGREKVEARN